jgi:hypothetical protein
MAQSTDSDAAKIKAAVANESRSYTDPKATYDIACTARTAQAQGAARRAS